MIFGAQFFLRTLRISLKTRHAAIAMDINIKVVNFFFPTSHPYQYINLPIGFRGYSEQILTNLFINYERSILNYDGNILVYALSSFNMDNWIKHNFIDVWASRFDVNHFPHFHNIYKYVHTYMKHIYIYIYWVCACVLLCVCDREREREKFVWSFFNKQ